MPPVFTCVTAEDQGFANRAITQRISEVFSVSLRLARSPKRVHMSVNAARRSACATTSFWLAQPCLFDAGITGGVQPFDLIVTQVDVERPDILRQLFGTAA